MGITSLAIDINILGPRDVCPWYLSLQHQRGLRSWYGAVRSYGIYITILWHLVRKGEAVPSRDLDKIYDGGEVICGLPHSITLAIVHAIIQTRRHGKI